MPDLKALAKPKWKPSPNVTLVIGIIVSLLTLLFIGEFLGKFDKLRSTYINEKRSATATDRKGVCFDPDLLKYSSKEMNIKGSLCPNAIKWRDASPTRTAFWESMTHARTETFDVLKVLTGLTSAVIILILTVGGSIYVLYIIPKKQKAHKCPPKHICTPIK